jgi:hypothetical protein
MCSEDSSRGVEAVGEETVRLACRTNGIELQKGRSRERMIVADGARAVDDHGMEGGAGVLYSVC